MGPVSPAKRCVDHWLREGLQLRQSEQRHARGQGDPVGRLLRHLVVPRGAARPRAGQRPVRFLRLPVRARARYRPRHVRQAGVAQLVADGPGGHGVLGQRRCLDVLDPTWIRIRTSQLRGHCIRHRPDVRPDRRHVGSLRKPHDLSVALLDASLDPSEGGANFYRTLTIAKIRTEAHAEYVDVLCLESARIYRLGRARPGFEELLGRLQHAELDQRAVSLGLTSETSDIIADVQVP